MSLANGLHLLLYHGILIVFILFIQQPGVFGKYVHGAPKYSCPERAKLIYPCVCLKGSDVGLYVTCNNTNLASLSVGLEILSSLDVPIEHLIINKGNFESLYGPLFAKVPARLLSIIDTAITSIEDYAFFGLNNTLEVLNLTNTHLSQITSLSFGILGKLQYLKIDGHQLESLNQSLFIDQEISNRLEFLQMINGPLSNIPIETFQPLKKLKTLDLHGNRLENLKRNQFKNLRELEVLDISFNKLRKLEGQHIADLTKLGWFNASHNNLTELARGTFARNAVLKVLNLSHNKIQRLDANSFRGMRFLRRLYLSDNQIKDIGRGTFGSIARIGTIDLARNFLQKVEFQMFSQLNYLEILDVSANNISLIEKNSFKDIYQASINISHNILEMIESRAFENCVNITVLDLSFNRLRNFSKHAFDETTFANSFQLSHNLISSAMQIPIQNMTGIRILNASYNNISVIPKNTFPKLYELHTIDFSHNNISSIFNGVFQTLFSLRSINLSHNGLEEIKSSMFGTLPTLIDLDLSHNRLHNIIRGALAKLTSLRWLNLAFNHLDKLFQIPISLNELYLSDNRLKAIPSGTWPVMNSLIYLDLSRNQLEDALTDTSFLGLLVLQKLLLIGNGISKPPAAALAPLSTLQYLYLQDNNITVLEKNAFGKLPVLFELNLHNNGVKDISIRAFEGLLQLLNLNLSSNDLHNLSNEIFIGLPSLRKLDLSGNYLSKLDNKTHGVLEDLLSLEMLNLSHNRISFITKKSFPENPYIPYNLRYLDLSYNQMPVLTYDITFGTKRLLSLNLSHNQINELRRGVLGNFTNLQQLDLSSNHLSDLLSEAHSFDLPRNLTRLSLENNRIIRLNFTQFVKSPQFELIDLRANRLEEFPLTLVGNMKNGTEVLFSNNPLHCNCAIRPLKHYISFLSDYTEDLLALRCQSPHFNRNFTLLEIEDESLQCSKEEQLRYTGTDYDKLADVRFRDIILKNGNLTVRWQVISNRDIADFNIYIRDVNNIILYQQELLYNQRQINIPLNSLQTKLSENSEICIITLKSNGESGHWYPKQCQPIPSAKSNRNLFNLFTNSGTSTKTLNSLPKLLIPLTLFLHFINL